MKKIQYIQPKTKVESLNGDAFVMLLDSGSNLEPVQHAPQRITNPAAPKDSIGVWM